ncbi:hypothetical protein BDR26DRAFT_805261 [Obelidium mucronatum]|nr:hypothetical protein BDR26DRAFT_805261 [Obelidium mucronatum]
MEAPNTNTQTDQPCLNCGKNSISYETVPCQHKTLCKACAMKQATGGRCKICKELFVELRKL